MKNVFIGVGSNLGNREDNIKSAEALLRSQKFVTSFLSSQIYETNPVGGPPQGKFLNAVWQIEGHFTPRELFDSLRMIETSLGRKRTMSNGPRTMDLDVLFCDDFILNERDLVIPHPKIQERWFVLKPLWDLAADFIHPVLQKSICELLDECRAHH